MRVRVAALQAPPGKPLTGRQLQRLATPETLGRKPVDRHHELPGRLYSARSSPALRLRKGVLHPGWTSASRSSRQDDDPHKGDGALFPPNTQHMGRNAGRKPLGTAYLLPPSASLAACMLWK
jgi:hypothetical protein